MENKRIDHLDTCKGLLIILVVIGHAIEILDTEYTGYWFKVIYSFHMPAFFIISGYFLNLTKWKEKGFFKFLLSRIQKNLIPYFFFEFLYGAIVRFVIFHQEWNEVMDHLHTILIKSFTIYVNYVPSWFLITLFFSAILVYLLDNKDNKVLVCEIVILLLATYIGRLIMEVRFDITRDYLLIFIRTTLSSVFMMIGLLWRRVDLSKINSRIITVGCLALTLVIPYFTEWPSISSFNITYISLFVITGVTGTCVVVAFSKIVNCKALQFIGKESLLIMGTHQLVKAVLSYRFPDLYCTLLVIPVYLVGVVALEVIAIPLLNKCVPSLVGKNSLSTSKSK